MKKKFLSILLLGISASMLTGCGTPEIISTSIENYVYGYEPVFEDTYDEDMKIDGVMNESRWNNLNYLYFCEYNVNLEVTSFFTLYGVYIGGKATDSKMAYYGRFDMKNNSGFDINLAKNTQSIMQHSEIMKLEIDAYDKKSYYQDRFAGHAMVTGELNSGNPCTMTFEMFVSWSELGYKNVNSKEKIPSSVKICPVYRYVYRQSDSFVERHNITPTFGESTYMAGYFNFDAKGYANPEIESAALGNAKNGISKSDGWDLSHSLEDDPYYLSNYRGPQSIYFKDIYAENFIAETDAEIVSALGSSNNPRFGLIAHGDAFMDFRSMYVRGIVDNKWFYDSKILRCAEMTYYPNRTTVENDYIYLDRTSDLIQIGVKKLHLKMIKCGKSILFFVNDELLYSETQTWFDDKMSPGLFAQDASVKFTNFSAQEVSDSELINYLRDHQVSKVNVSKNISNGIVNVSKQAIKFDEQLSLNINPTNGYMLSELSINNISYYQQYLNNVNCGSLVLNDLPHDGNLDIQAKFNKLPSINKYLYGNIKTIKGKTISYATIKVTSSFNFLYFIDSSSSTGLYLFNYLPKDGDTILDYNGTTYRSDGLYNVSIEANGYRPTNITYYVGEDGYHLNGKGGNLIEGEQDIFVEARLLGGSTSSANFSYVSDLTGWDLTDEDKTPNRIIARRGSSNNPLYFSDVASRHAIIEMTVQDQTPIGDGYDPQPSFGISMQTGGFRVAIILDGTNIRLLPDFQWYNDADHLIPSNGLFSTTTKKEIGYKLIQKDSLIVLLVSPNNDGNYQLAYSGIWGDLNNLDIAYGLYARSSNLVQSCFSNISINTSLEYVNSEISEYISDKVTIIQPQNGAIEVTDRDGNKISNGDILVVGTELIVQTTSSFGYSVYANKVSGSNVAIQYSNNRRKATSYITFNLGAVITADIRLNEDIGQDIHMDFAPQATTSYLENYGTSYMETISGLRYSTDEAISSDSLERNVQIAMKPKVNDFSSFVSIEYEIIEGNSGEKVVPYLVDNSGGVFKIGGTRNNWAATRKAGSTIEKRTSSNWQGFSISGKSHAVYEVSLEDSYYYDSNITKYGGGITSTLNLNNISYLGLQTYAFKDYKWEFVVVSIKGVKNNGERVSLFEGKDASVKDINSDISALTQPNDAMLFYENGNGGTTNYQRLDVINNSEVELFDPDNQLWKVHYSESGDGYSWNNINLSNAEENFNLMFYDALVFDLDLSLGDWGQAQNVELSVELRYDNYSGTKYSRCRKYYLISENGDVTVTNTILIPIGFKGKVVALLDDFKINSNLNSHLFNVYSSARIIINTAGIDGAIFSLKNVSIISNGKELIGH